MEEFFQQLTNGLAVGGIYALIALGYTMVYGVLKLINFVVFVKMLQEKCGSTIFTKTNILVP